MFLIHTVASTHANCKALHHLALQHLVVRNGFPHHLVASFSSSCPQNLAPPYQKPPPSPLSFPSLRILQ